MPFNELLGACVLSAGAKFQIIRELTMNVQRGLLQKAVERGLLSEQQAEQLWLFLQEQGKDTASFRFTHILYYFGGMLAIGAMSLFMTLGWERFGGWGLFGVAVGYFVAAIALTERFLNRDRLPIPAGITAAFAIVLIPLAVFGVQSAFGQWPPGQAFRQYHTLIDRRWLTMELVTLAVGPLLLLRYRLPFLLMPITVTLWYLSMDLAPFLFGDADLTWQLRKQVSLWFGLAMILLAFWIDMKTWRRKDYAFWLYLFGVIAFWGGLSLMSSTSELGKFGYLCINLSMIVIGAMLSRRVFAILGGLGAAGYLGHLAYDLFKNSMLFPFALTAIGLLVIYAGIAWQRNETQFSGRLRALLPASLRGLIEGRLS
jgi:hypothetical protein